ncbi:MAG: dihydrofolate reductase family protein [Caldilineaceae bacterium]
MTNRQVILYIAMSLDGYIAKENNDISFLSVVENPPEDYGYGDFIQTVDTVVMGRKTYDKVLSFGIEFPHRGRTCYVLSRSKTGADENVQFYNGDVATLLTKIRAEEGANIFIDGGAEVVFELMQQNLIDRYIISIIPIFVGSGVLLFKSGRLEQKLKLTRSVTFPTGLVQLWYEKQP